MFATLAPYVLAVVSLGGPFLFWVGFQMSGYTNQKLGVFLMLLSGILWLIAISVSVVLYWEKIRKFISTGCQLVFVSYPVLSTIVVIVMVGGLAGWGWWQLGKLIRPAAASRISPAFKPLTLHDYFLGDFKSLDNSAIEKEFASSQLLGEKIKILFRVHMDFQSKSEFISAYFPHSRDDRLAYQAISKLPDTYEQILNESKSWSVGNLNPGDSSMEHSKDLTFTGKIFIYHEDELSLEQLGALEVLFKGKNLLPQFRGNSYATTRLLQSQAQPKQP